MKTLLSLVCCCCLTGMATAQFAEDRGAGKPPAGDTGFVGVLRDLQEAKELIKKLPVSTTRDRLELLVTRSELQLKQMGQNFNTPRPTPMNQEEFNRFSINLRNQSFDKDKLAFLENFMSTRYVNCQQASILLKHFSFDSDRIKGAVLIYTRLTDVDNFHRVLEIFTFDSSKKTVMEQLKRR